MNALLPQRRRGKNEVPQVSRVGECEKAKEREKYGTGPEIYLFIERHWLRGLKCLI
jgi:hypothetical protein